MRNTTTVELDAYQLAKFAQSVPCYVCDGPNKPEAELCRHCFAPMALGHQAKSAKVKPQMIAAIGSSGVGKTVFLGVLMDMVARRSRGMQVLARGAFSINLQQKTLAALQTGEFPGKTPTEPDRWNWVHCQVRTADASRPFDLIMPDMAGEALLEEIDQPSTYKVVRSFLSRCAGVMVLIDSMRLSGGTADQDYFTMKLLTYLAELETEDGKGWRRRPVAIVFSKADQCDDAFEDPADFAQRRANGLWQHCSEEFKKHKFFAASVTGTCAFRDTLDGRIQVPLRVEPRGITEPFEWLIRQLK
jgi:hypothetical protein